MPLEQLESGHHSVEGGLAALVDAVGVVELARAINAETDKEIVFPEKPTPFRVEAGSVGLDCVRHFPSPPVSFLKLHNLPEIIHSEESGFAALPGHRNFAAGLVGQVVADVGLENLRCHSEICSAREEGLLLEVIAVCAIEIANRADRFRHDMEWGAHGCKSKSLQCRVWISSSSIDWMARPLIRKRWIETRSTGFSGAHPPITEIV